MNWKECADLPIHKERFISRILLPALIVLFGLVSYSNTYQSSFHFDDYTYIVDKPQIRDLSDIKSIYRALGHPSRFISFLSFAVNYHLHGTDVFGYHVVNIIIHLMNGLLVYALIQLLFRTDYLSRSPSAAVKLPLAFTAALVFTVHPLQTEAVTYIVQRFTSLATFFYLSSICCYLVAKSRPESVRIIGYGFFVLLMLCGMFTKQICFTIPIMIMMIELFFYAGGIREIIRRQWKLIGMLLISLCIIPSFFGFNVDDIVGRTFDSRSHSGDVLNTRTYFMTQWRVVMTYLRLTIWPVHQTLDYDYPISTSWSDWRVWGAMLFFAGLVWVAVRQWHTRRLFAFGLGWFVISISVTSSIIPIPHVIFEHRMYLPITGVLLMILSWVPIRFWRGRAWLIVVLSVGIILSIATHRRNEVWKTGLSLWEDIARKAPGKVRVHNNLGMAYYEIGEYDRSIGYFDQAIQLNPHAARVYNNRGMAYLRLGDPSRALVDFNAAIQRYYTSRQFQEQAMKPIWAEMFNNRADLLVAQSRFEAAVKDYETAQSIDPLSARAVYGIGYIHELNRRFDQAAAAYRKALDIDPRFERAWIGLGFMYRDAGRSAEAVEFFNQAIAVNPDNGEAYFYRGIARFERRQLDQAREDMRRSMALGYNPGSEELKKVRAKILEIQ